MAYTIKGGKGAGATFVNPRVSLSGLFFYIDPSNIRCYNGFNSPFLSLISNSTFYTNTTSVSTESSTLKYINFNSLRSLSGTIISNLSTCSLQIWVRNLSSSNNFYNLVYTNYSNSSSFGIFLNKNKFGVFANNEINNTTVDSVTGDWELITLNYEPSSIKLFKDLSYYELEKSSGNLLTDIITIGNNNLDVGQVMFYNRHLSFKEIQENYRNFTGRYNVIPKDEQIIKPYVENLDNDALNYFNLTKITDNDAQVKVNRFIIELKINDLWNNVVAAWVLSKKYNTGIGLSAYSLKDNQNVAVMRSGASNILPTWEDNGVRFYEDGADDASGILGPRMDVPYWNSPNLQAPMSMVVLFSPFANKVGSPLGASLFGKTSWGWGTGLNHFGFNFDYSNFVSYWSYNPEETKKEASTFISNINYNVNFFMGAMTTDNYTVSGFINNTTYTDPNYPNGYTWDSRIALDRVGFSQSFNGAVPNREFNGLITSAFIFNKQIDYNLFYKIYKRVFKEFNLP